uniref:Sas10 C-terminal domain-containing protein n=1 Tax=Cuerna arida TaxID=1464854 RepID=A0A1B6H1S0_9HEMI
MNMENYEDDKSHNSQNCKTVELPKSFSEVDDSIAQLNRLVERMKEEVKGGKLNTSDGISLLDVKNQMMLSYLINTVYVVAKKCHGRSIEGDPAIERLVEIRTVLERIRPLEHKLKYMMEKLVKTVLTGATNENDATRFKSNMDNMADNLDGSGSESENEEGATSEKKSDKKSGVYVPPRLAPMHYDEEENQAARKQKQLERAKRRALHSSVVEELREQYLDTPAEVSHGNALKATISKHQRLKNQYEEEYFTRLPTSKKDRHRGRHSMTVGNIGDHLTHFENISVLEDEGAFSGQKRKRKSGGKLKQGKKKGFKRRKGQSL